MSKHTPGPWTVIPYGGFDAKGEQIEGFYIGCDIGRDGCHKIAKIETTKWSRDEHANANLIAAAPDLLEALESALHGVEDNHPLDADITSWQDAARTAIARAKGEK